MSTIRLPDEVCEEIIDNCRSFMDGGNWAPEDSYQVLLACSLTCQAWLPRSRLRLYSMLLFRRHRDVSSFLETIAAHPFLADLARTMCIHSTREYIPFADSHSVLAQKLPNIRTMWLAVNWDHYPTKYHAVIEQYPLTQLYIDFHPMDMVNMRLFRLVYSLPNLRQLHRASTLHGRIMKPASLCPPISDADVLRTTLPPTQPRRRTIIILALELEAIWFDIGNMSAAMMFGTSVVELTIRCLTTRSSPQRLGLHELLAYTSLLSSLKTLTLIVEPRNLHSDVLGSTENATVFYPWIVTALCSAREHAALRVVRLRFWGPESVWKCAPLSRHGFLDMVVTRALEDTLCDIPALSQLVVELPAGPGDLPDACRWWETELRKRLLRLNAQISAAVHPGPNTSQPQACRPVWIDFREDTPDPHQILPQVRYANYNVRGQIPDSELLVVYDCVPLTEALEWRGVSQPDELTFPQFADVGKKLGILVAPAELQLPREEPLVKLHFVRGWATGGQGVVPITRAELAYLVSAELRALMQAYPLVRGGTAVEFARLCLIDVHQVMDDTLQALFGIMPSGQPLTAH